MKMMNAHAIQAHRIYRIAASEKVVTRVQTNTEQIRISTLTQTCDFFRRFHKRSGMMMEDGSQSRFATGLRDATKHKHCVVPLLITHPIASLINPTRHGHAPLAHLISQDNQRSSSLRQQLSDIHCLAITRLVSFRVGQWNGNKAGDELQPPI